MLGVLADDLDGILVGAHRAVSAEAVEHGADHGVGLGGERGIVVEAGVGNVVVDAYGEVIFDLGLGLFQIVVNRLDHGGSEFFGGEAVAAADDCATGRVRSSDECVRSCVFSGDSFLNRVHHVLIERLADGAAFFGAIEDGDLADGLGEGLEERLHTERAIQVDFEQTDFFSVGVEVVDGFVRDFGSGTHHDDNALGVGRAHVVEEVILTAGDLSKLVHDRLHLGGGGVVERIRGLADLEEDVGILRRAAQHGMVGRERALAVLDDAVQVDHGAHVGVVQHFDLVDFVRGAEAVEEVEEGNAGLERGGVGDQGEVLGFLHGVGAEHGPSGGAAEHHIGVIAENRKRVGGDGAGRDVERCRSQFTRNLVHVGDHQQQALRGGEGRGQRSGLQGAVNRAGGSAFTLHFNDMRDAAPGVGHGLRGPLVGPSRPSAKKE